MPLSWLQLARLPALVMPAYVFHMDSQIIPPDVVASLWMVDLPTVL